MLFKPSPRTLRRGFQRRFERRARQFGRYFIAAFPRHVRGVQKLRRDHDQGVRQGDGKRNESRLFRRFQTQRGDDSHRGAHDERICPLFRVQVQGLQSFPDGRHREGRGSARQNARTSARS